MYRLNLTRLIAGLLFFVMSGSAFAQQRVTVDLNQSNLRTLFNVIEKQTTYRFSYINGVLEKEVPITIHQTDVPVNVVLDKAFKGTGLSFKIVSDTQIMV